MLGSLTPVQDIDAKEYSRILSLNVLANQALIAAFDPLLRKADRADIVALTSSVGGEPRAFWGAYGSSKAALETLLGAYADETAHTGRIRVHIVDPGATRTRMRALAFPGEEPESVKPPEVVAQAIVERLRRTCRPARRCGSRPSLAHLVNWGGKRAVKRACSSNRGPDRGRNVSTDMVNAVTTNRQQRAKSSRIQRRQIASEYG